MLLRRDKEQCIKNHTEKIVRHFLANNLRLPIKHRASQIMLAFKSVGQNVLG